MKIMLVNPRPLADRLGPMERFSPSIPPLGPVMLATILNRDGHAATVVDQHARRWTTDQLLAEVERQGPDLVGFSCLTFAMDGVEHAVAALRGRFPAVRIVLGNLHAALFHEQLVHRGLADVVVRGEGDGVLPALVRALESAGRPAGVPGLTWRRGEEVVVEPEAPPVDLSLLPVPDWSLVAGVPYEAFRLREFDQGPLPAAIQASRGCRFHCRFCSQNLLYKELRTRPVRHVVDEIETLVAQGIPRFGFMDANFPPDREYGLAFAREVRSRGLHKSIRWLTEVRLDLVDEELLRELAAAGLRLVQFGVESGDRETLRTMHKGHGWDDPAAAFEWCRRLGILTVGLFVIGMPGETEERIARTIEAAVTLDPDLAKFSVATPYPGTQLWHDFYDELKDVPSWKFSGWLDPRRGGEHLLEKHTLPTARLTRLQRQAMRRFYLRPHKLASLFGRGLLRPRVLLDGARSMLRGWLEA